MEEHVTFRKIILIAINCIWFVGKGEYSENYSQLIWHFYLLYGITTFYKVFTVFYTEYYISHHIFWDVSII